MSELCELIIMNISFETQHCDKLTKLLTRNFVDFHLKCNLQKRDPHFASKFSSKSLPGCYIILTFAINMQKLMKIDIIEFFFHPLKICFYLNL